MAHDDAIFEERDKRIAELEARIAELMADAMALVECWGNLAIRNEASMAVWKDKLSPDMLAGMAQDRVEGFAAVKRLRRVISYVLAGGQFGIEPGFVVLALANVATAKDSA